MKNDIKQELMELIDTLPEEDCKKAYAFLYGVFFTQDEYTVYYGKDGEIWIARTL